MSETMTFESRLRRLMRRHSKMYANGVVHRVGRDGLITAHPRRRMPGFPLRGIVLLFLAALLYKSFLFAYLGAATYENRVADLAAGSIVERAGAWALQADPATIATAGLFRSLVPTL